jgi:large subunit ribosomal protein L21
MKAVFKFLGKQYLCSSGDEVVTEKANLSDGSKIKIDEILLIIDGEKIIVGNPNVPNAQITAEVLETKKGKKVSVIKFHAKKRYKRSVGHRQFQTTLKINKIEVK